MTGLNIAAEFSRLRPQLLGFARLQLRADDAAEDLVQDALLAALQTKDQFSGASSFKTWVFAILKHKIIDELRRRARRPQAEEAEAALEEAVAELFNEREHWAEVPSPCGDPAASLEQKHFWEVLNACINNLPPSPARVFAMREFLGLET